MLNLKDLNFYFRAVVPPITTSTAYHKSTPSEKTPYKYARYHNPTRCVLTECLASLDNAKFALAFSTGNASLTALITTLEMGDGILTTKEMYGGSIQLFRDLALKMNIDVTFIDFTDLKSVENSLKPNTKMIWLESPSNPLIKVFDIKAIADLVHVKSKAFVVVDNTFLTSYFQRPLELGADAVMYSMTKYINGHNDVTMGAITTNDEKLYDSLHYYQISIGVTPSPFDCYLVNRSLKTLSLRMERHSENAFAVAKFLELHPKIEKVFHPSLKSHENHEVALRQCYGHSGIMSFYLKGTKEDVTRFFTYLKLVALATSLGGSESVISFPWTMSHEAMPENERIEIGVTESLVRISVGLEDATEIIEDLEQALNQV